MCEFCSGCSILLIKWKPQLQSSMRTRIPFFTVCTVTIFLATQQGGWLVFTTKPHRPYVTGFEFTRRRGSISVLLQSLSKNASGSRAFFEEKPLAYLDEAQDAIIKHFQLSISKTSVWRIIHNFGLTWKVLERWTIHIKERDVFRFAEELSHVNWTHQNIVFSGRSLLRQQGHVAKA
ncbi:hypothetical protein L914_10669 [Phytophthora nicotianae]|uniref:Uncharacterized protein n=2 Tax=Phytophthora nicotianae TaxID=4792 RepID=V9EZ84_PHYNI|nr:hypothetical protein F443_11108 [Phytophthora nicotianae P1569]ETM44062.1 hypothetical protein L914_10669 [Phytophthora nicotianae]